MLFFYLLSIGNRPLPDVYKEITEMQVDINKYRQWSSKEKSLQPAAKIKANILFILQTYNVVIKCSYYKSVCVYYYCVYCFLFTKLCLS